MRFGIGYSAYRCRSARCFIFRQSGATEALFELSNQFRLQPVYLSSLRDKDSRFCLSYPVSELIEDRLIDVIDRAGSLSEQPQGVFDLLLEDLQTPGSTSWAAGSE